MADSVRVVLASGSPRRQELLGLLGVRFRVVVPDVDESVHPGETPDGYVRRVASLKAAAVDAEPGEVVLAADTTVVIDGMILGKPIDDLDAAGMLRQLSGRRHDCLTGVALRTSSLQVEVVRTGVTFVELSDADISAYVATGEPADKAGAYAIQGRAGAFVSSIEGSPSNVIGLPLHLVRAMLARVA